MPGTSRSCSQGISTHWGTWRSLNVQENNCCNGFGMRGHWQGQVPLCLQPHQVSHPSNRWWKTSHRNPVRGNRHKHLTTGSSSQFPTIMAETEEEGFFVMAKDPSPRRYFGLWHLCKASLHCAPRVWQGHGLPRAHVAVTTPVSVYDHPREASTQGT